MNPKGNIFLIPTYLSTSNDAGFIAPMVADILKNLSHFLVENVRTSRRFISSLNLGLDISSLQFEVIDKHTSQKDVHQLMTQFSGKDVGLMSEAGLPCLADPGNLVVSYAHQNHMKVIPLPGASAIQMALTSSGFNGQQFIFHGYVPIEKEQRIAFIKQLEIDLIRNGYTQVFMETPYRNMQLIETLVNTLAGTTLLSVATDISGEKECIRTQTIKEWKSNKFDFHKLPAMFSIGHFPL